MKEEEPCLLYLLFYIKLQWRRRCAGLRGFGARASQVVRCCVSLRCGLRLCRTLDILNLRCGFGTDATPLSFSSAPVWRGPAFTSRASHAVDIALLRFSGFLCNATCENILLPSRCTALGVFSVTRFPEPHARTCCAVQIFSRAPCLFCAHRAPHLRACNAFTSATFLRVADRRCTPPRCSAIIHQNWRHSAVAHVHMLPRCPRDGAVLVSGRTRALFAGAGMFLCL